MGAAAWLMAVVDLSVACHTSESECRLRLKNRELRFLFFFFFFFLPGTSELGAFPNNPKMKFLFLMDFRVSLD